MVVVEKTITGEVFHRIEELGSKKYVHIGFEDKDKKFGDMLESLVPEIGMRKRAEITIRLLDDV